MAESVDKDDLLAQFQSITGADVDRAQFFLESSNWKLDLAVATFFENGDEGGEAAAEGGASAEQAMEQDNPPPAAKEEKKEAAKPKDDSKFRTLGSMRAGEDEDSDEDDDDHDQGQAFFAGGSTQSGQQILGPPKKKGADFVSKMFKMAKDSGAEQVEASSAGAAGPSGGAGRAFTGSAFRLGSDDTPSQHVPSNEPSKQAQPREFALKMWSNGFSVDDGELRAYNDPQNREFLASVMTGRIPQELVREARGGEVHVNMEDHKTEDYVKPKASSKPFQGQGHVLGGATPEVVGAASTAAPAAAAPTPAANAANEQKAKEEVKVDSAQPTTNIQVRLADGSRLVATLNHSHTVADLRRYIVAARPHLAAETFNVLTTFPSKVLENDAATLSEAGILNAAVMLRKK